MRINEHDRPREAHLMTVIKDYNNQRRHKNELNALVDRGFDTETRFEIFREFQRTVEILLKTDTFVAYRTRTNLLISQYMLLRSENQRHADFCDLIAIESLNEAEFQKNVQMLILRLRQDNVLFLFIHFFDV